LTDDQVVFLKIGPLNQLVTINCPRCKQFNVTDLFLVTAPEKPETIISAWIRNLNEQGVEGSQITTDTIKDLKEKLSNYNPREKQIILLQNIERKTEYPGQRVMLDFRYDFPLAWASTDEEFLYYINYLQNRGFLDSHMSAPVFYVTITPDGWDYLEQHDRRIEERTQAFVAMSFSEDLKPIWEGPIYNAIKKAGYKPYRVDAEPHSDRIDFKIIAEIKNSRFLIADVTEHKLGVYFEAGYALGLGLPVIWCVRKDDLDKVHFDTRQYNHIVWETESDLENQLYNFICAIIGKGKEVP